MLPQNKNTNRKTLISHEDFRCQQLYSTFMKKFWNKQTVSSPPELGNLVFPRCFFLFEGNISMHFPISLHKHTSCITCSIVLCISAKQAMRKETEDSATTPKSTLSKGTHHHGTWVTYQISHQTHHYSLSFSGCSWGHSASVLQIRRAAWVASYRWSKRVILLPRGILLSSISTNNHQRPQKKPRHYCENWCSHSFQPETSWKDRAD